MSILAALASHYDRLADAGEAPMPGYSAEKISFAIALGADGAYLGQTFIGQTVKGKMLPTLIRVPQSPKRTSGIAANLLWDKTSYALGVTADTSKPERTAAEHETFKKRQRDAIGDSDDPGLKALLAFLRDWTPDRFAALGLPADMLDTNIVFTLGELADHYIHDRPAARQLVTGLLASSDAQQGTCLVTGRYGPIAITHADIRGVRNAQSSGAAIVSFNQKSFTSYGKDDGQGLNAPVSETAAFAYTTALNTLLANPLRRVQIGDATVVFWVDPLPGDTVADAESTSDFFGSVLAEPPPESGQETEKLFADLKEFAQGKPLAELGRKIHPDTVFHVLGLSPNAARLSIRFWYETSIVAFEALLHAHYSALLLEPLPWNKPPTVRRLAAELAPYRKRANGRFEPDYDQVPPQIAGELTRAILTGGPYPLPMLTLVLMRLRSDGQVSPLRVALIKAALIRQQKEIPVGLDENEKNPGYTLGRLFAVLESLQKSGLGKLNANVKDKFYASASTTPGYVFPALMKNAKNHMKSVRTKHGPNLESWFEKRVSEIFFLIEMPFPESLKYTDQGSFAIGYYHQKEAMKRKTIGTQEELTPEVIQVLDNLENETKEDEE
jgi:CRISPR-associated protein Csd1